MLIMLRYTPERATGTSYEELFVVFWPGEAINTFTVMIDGACR